MSGLRAVATQNLSTPEKPAPATMTTLPPSRLASWLITSVVVGWAVVYNVLRIDGRSPRGAAGVSFLIGLGVGAVVFAVAVLVWRRVVSGARYQAAHLNEIPPAARLDERQKSAVDVLWPAVGVMALLALLVGALMAWKWAATTGSRSHVRIVIGVWDLLVGSWLMFETGALRTHDAEAVESIGTAALLSAVLAGVAMSLGMYQAAQGAMVVVSAVTAAIAYFAGWRLLGSRGVPFASISAVIVGALALIVPLAT